MPFSVIQEISKSLLSIIRHLNRKCITTIKCYLTIKWLIQDKIVLQICLIKIDIVIFQVQTTEFIGITMQEDHYLVKEIRFNLNQHILVKSPKIKLSISKKGLSEINYNLVYYLPTWLMQILP